MAASPINGFYQCWYPYTGRFTEQSRPMSYWIQFPDPEADIPVGGWPVLIMIQGGTMVTNYIQTVGSSARGCNTRANHVYNAPVSGGATVEIWRPDVLTSPYYTYPAICIIPDISDYSEWLLDSTETDNWYYYKHIVNSFGGYFAGIPILKALVQDLIDGDAVFYDDAACETEWDGLDNTTVDSSRIYASGYSYGGGAVFKMAVEMRDMLAGVVMGAGWPFGEPYKDHYTGGNEFDYMWSLAIARRVEMAKHIPILCHCGNADGMYQSMSGLLRCYEAIGGTSHNMRFAYLDGVGHDGGWAGWTDYANKYFDPDVLTRQEFQASGAGLVNAIEWLFSQTKPVTPDNPYPNEDEETTGIYRDYGISVSSLTSVNGLVRYASDGGSCIVGNLTIQTETGVVKVYKSGVVIQSLDAGESCIVSNGHANADIFCKSIGEKTDVLVEYPKRYTAIF